MNTEDVNQNVPTQDAESSATPVAEGNGGGKGWLVGLVIIIIVILFFVFRGGDAEDVDLQTDEDTMMEEETMEDNSMMEEEDTMMEEETDDASMEASTDTDVEVTQ